MFNKNFVHTSDFSKTAGKTASDLFYLRQKADYDFIQDIDEELTRKCINDAADFFKEVADYLSKKFPELSMHLHIED